MKKLIIFLLFLFAGYVSLLSSGCVVDEQDPLHPTALCGNDSGVDAPEDIDAPIDASVDAPAPPEIDPDAPWDCTEIVPHAQCQGADGVDTSDFDHDGDEDVGDACEQGNKGVVAKNNGDGTFTRIDMTGGAPSISAPEHALWCDANGDGWDDYFLLETGGQRISLWINNQGAGFGARQIIATGQRFMFGVCAGPGQIIVGGYGVSPNASIDRITLNVMTGGWVREILRSAEWIKTIVKVGNDYLVWEKTGQWRGVSWLFTGQRMAAAQDANTEWGSYDPVTQLALVGTVNPTTGVSTLKIINVAAGGTLVQTISWPALMSWYHYAIFDDVNGDGKKDIVISGSHSTDANSSWIFLKRVDVVGDNGQVTITYTQRYEIIGLTGSEKQDNFKRLDDGFVGTEEKTRGVLYCISPFNPRRAVLHQPVQLRRR